MAGYCSKQRVTNRTEKMGQGARQAKKEGKIVVLGRPGDRIRDAMTQGFAKAFPDIGLELSGARGG